MISCDTNILFSACDLASPFHSKAREFLTEYGECDGFCLCEQVLMELYCLLRNPTVCRCPLDAHAAVQMIQGFRSNPRWRIVDVVQGSDIMKQVWRAVGADGFAYRRIFDVRIGITLRHHGVTEFATRNTKDFGDQGFTRLWDPLS
jgi:toxin-antitoxin system PIN domain toxin